jgi:hypothetical protein
MRWSGFAGGLACGAGLWLGAAGVAGAEVYRVTLAPGSTLTSSFAASANFSGTLIGNYDAVSNPGGTRTLLGAFGLCTSGNQPIPYTGTGGATGSPSTSPTGSFVLEVMAMPAGGTVCLSGLSIDLLGGAMPTIPTSSSMTYQGFRTCQPTGFFPSLTVPIPLGDAVVTAMTAEQAVRNSPGTLEPIGGGRFSFSVPTMVTVGAAITLGGNPVDTSPQTLPVTVTGTIDLTMPAAPPITVALSVAIMEEATTPAPGPQDVPFDLANPLGGTVHLLVDITVDSSSVDITGAAEATATGVPITPCRGDWNGDGMVNSQDYFDFLTAFFAAPPDADFNCSGTTNSQDYFDSLAAFFVGC